jgi:hypothetical protein
MRLSPHEIAYLAIKAGFRTAEPPGLDSEVVLFVATCLAESGGETETLARSASGMFVGNRDHGLAQISGRWHGDKIAAAGGDWRNPAVNVAIAYRIFVDSGRSLAPWNAYKAGKHEQFLPDARIGAMHPWPPKPYPAVVDEFARRMERA